MTETTTDLTSLAQPMLLESAEFRRRVDSDRTTTLAKIDRLMDDIAAAKMQLSQMEARLADLQLIINSADGVLETIPAPGTSPANAIAATTTPAIEASTK